MKQSIVMGCVALLLMAVASTGCTSMAASDGLIPVHSGGTANARKDIEESTKVPPPSGPATPMPACSSGASFCR